jgi:hypothetical protein
MDLGPVTSASICVEKSFANGQRPSPSEIEDYSKKVVLELQSWGFIGEVEVVHPTWIEVAYTWSHPGSTWKAEALALLEQYGISSIGRYGRWQFQGIADSIRDGLMCGAAVTATFGTLS